MCRSRDDMPYGKPNLYSAACAHQMRRAMRNSPTSLERAETFSLGGLSTARCFSAIGVSRNRPISGLELFVRQRVEAEDATVGPFECGNVCHVVRRQLEVEYRQILRLTLAVGGLGQRHGTELHMPA